MSINVTPHPEFPAGEAVRLTPLLRRITAPNAGKLTGPGTNTYLVGNERVAVIDPGVRKASHIDAILEATGGNIGWVLVTHTHPDHSPGARELATATGAPVLGHHLKLQGSRDKHFEADGYLDEGDTVRGPDFTLRALYTPGHAVNHLCYHLAQENLLIAGDQVMGGSTVVIAPPDGHMGDYLRSLERMKQERFDVLAPAHGDLMPDPDAVIQQIIDHRMAREGKIVDALQTDADQSGRGLSIGGIVSTVYSDVPLYLHPLARLSVQAHLTKLEDEARVRNAGRRWRLNQA